MTAKEWTNRLLGRGGIAEEAPVRVRRYMLRERLASIGDDFPIEDEEGELAFSVDGKALHNMHTLILRDSHGNDLYRIPERMLHLKTFMEIERSGGGTAATIRRTKIGTMRDRWTVTLADGKTLQLRGSVADHEYRIDAGERRVADLSKRWFRQPHTYGVAVSGGEDDALLLTIAAAVDQMTR